MGNCLGIGHNYARVGNSYEFDIETLQNSIDVKTQTIETNMKHLELKYNGALTILKQEIRDVNGKIKTLENKVNGVENNFDIRIGILETGIEDNRTKTISIKRKFRDLGNMINNMSSSNDSVKTGNSIFESEEASEYTETTPERPKTPIPIPFPSSFKQSEDSAFKPI